MPAAWGVLWLLAAYLVGSIPWGLLAGRVNGIDIRQHGSGNIGATNVLRVLGKKWGILVLLLDALKGALPVALPPLLFPDDSTHGVQHWQVGAGMLAIAGHMFPCWLGFRGGKGVATALGVVVCLAPWGALAAFVTFALSIAIWRYVSLSSILASLAFAVCQMILLAPRPFSPANWSLAVFSLLVPALIIIRHRTNMVRLVRGVEPKLGAPKPAASIDP